MRSIERILKFEMGPVENEALLRSIELDVGGARAQLVPPRASRRSWFVRRMPHMSHPGKLVQPSGHFVNKSSVNFVNKSSYISIFRIFGKCCNIFFNKTKF